MKRGDEHKNNIPNLVQSREIVDFILNFLSTSNNETLLCVFLCLIAVTYIVLGRVGLILIGFVLGIVLHASWDGISDGSASNEMVSKKSNKKRELALEVVKRLIDRRIYKSTDINVEDNPEPKAISQASKIDLEYSAFRPETASALRSLTDAVIQNYVNYWYEPILPSETSFPLSCRRILTDFITSVSFHLARKRTTDTFLEFLTNSSSITIVFLNELSTAFDATDTYIEPEQNIKRYLELFPESSLSNVLAVHQQQKKLNMAADDILSNFLDRSAYSCPAIRDFLREVLAGVVFESMVSSLSRPEFINGWIIHIFSEGESEIMSAIDAGVEGARKQDVAMRKGPSDSANVALVSADNTGPDLQSGSKTSGKQILDGDKATEEAIMETKRLSVLIAAQDAQSQTSLKDAKNDPRGLGTLIGGDDAAPTHPNGEMIQSPMGKHLQSKEYPNDEKMQNIIEHMSEKRSESMDPVRSPLSPSVSMDSFPKGAKSSFDSTNGSPLLTLHGASVLVDDGSEPGERGLIRSKPTSNYLLQIEPVSSRSTGWMVFRKYADFESLHETLETISRLNKIRDFTDQYPTLPPWKGQTRTLLTQNLELYLHDALQHESLAECERMRRFLEKDGSPGPESAGGSVKTGFSFPSQFAFENMGKGVLDALTNAPKGVAGGGKAVLGGVTGVLGGVGSGKKRSSSAANYQNLKGRPLSNEPLQSAPDEVEGLRSRETSIGLNTNTNGHLSSPDSHARQNILSLDACSDRKPPNDSGVPQNESSRSASSSSNPAAERSLVGLDTDDPCPFSPKLSNTKGLGDKSALLSPGSETKAEATCHPTFTGLNAPEKQNSPITHEETHMAVELIFAVINELYTLSSAWNIRRTLLNAAKSYILRPGSPNLETIRSLLQDSMIDAHTSDEAIGVYLTKVRENCLPTEAELNSWPPSPGEVEKERLKETARKLLVQRGLPQALTSVMGAAASREALEKIFDCLQVETIARGLIFSILLQALRAVIL
ncbi:hypothetical protein ASPWEDRAFT_117004 [Aspergillus wentii DTO 134E9]|uniref:PXA domain-containing protein n=1 Tax=Aspergillus wentii DTO 134E9 TaxID=1073089 RepID=A0A1L9RA32_ASPWE|nr:uncharacterized protein ASPWEDRAFT_117004 [Aspergillus wentii DTO 134E9]OJJ31781.1 hypothetical protein ASPWEDRAFT_117004 [Aspergillus wentii DTO 134E9]